LKKRKKLNKFDQTPRRTILRTQAQTGIDFAKQIKEITDNSVDAGAHNIDVILDPKKNIFKVKDDGCGMDEEGLQNATIAAVSNKDVNDGLIGRFGVGLKNAAHALADTYAISTTQASSPHKFFYEEDLVNMTSWVHDGVEQEDVDASEKDHSGTTVIFYLNDQYKITKNKIAQAQKELGDSYDRLIKKSNLNIRINGTKIEPLDIEFKDEVFPRKEIIIECGDKKVKAEIGVTTVDHWGVNLCNNNRKIVSKIKDSKEYNFGVNHYSVDRGFHATIDLDEFDVNNSKTGFIRNDRFTELSQAFIEHKDVKKLLSAVRKYNTDRKTKSNSMNKDAKKKMNDALNKAARILNKKNILDDYELRSVIAASTPHSSGLQKKLSQRSQNGSPKNAPTSKPKPNPKKKPQPSSGNYPTVKWDFGGMKMKMVIDDFEDEKNIIKAYDIKDDVYTCFLNVLNPAFIMSQQNGGVRLFAWNQLAESVAEYLIKDKNVAHEDAWKMRNEIINLGPECLA